jgi:hypothetical protein
VAGDVPDIARDLYAEPPEGFVEARNALAKELKASGDTSTAATVAKLKRPTVAASVVNLGARAAPELVERLLGAGTRMAGAQRALLSKKPTAAKDLRSATDERRRLVRELADVAIDAATEAGRNADHLRDEVAGTFEAATLDEDLAARLREATIEKSVTPSAGLRAIEGFAVIPGGADASGDEDVDDAEVTSAGDRALAKADAAAREAKQARSVADRALKAADRAGEKADRLAKAAEDAERAARDARAEERRLRDEASTARRRAERAERAARAAAGRAPR